MRILSKYLWSSLILLLIVLAASWWTLQRGNTNFAPHLIESVGHHITENSVPEPPSGISSGSTSNPIPQVQTYYRWTDSQGNTGYSYELPQKVISFKAIVLTGGENVLATKAPRL